MSTSESPDPVRQVRHAAVVGTEVVISVVVALVFFVVFLGLLSLSMPSAVSMRDVMQPSTFERRAGVRGLFAPLENLDDLSDRLNPTAALLTVMTTTVKRKPAGGIAWGTVPSTTELKEGDAVQTSFDGKALLTFGHGERLQLGPNSLIIVHGNVSPTEAGGPPSRPSVHVLLGELWGNVAREGASGDAVSVQAPGVEALVAPARGSGSTQFRVAVLDNKSSVFSVYRGTADVVARGRTVRVAANQFVSMDSLRRVGYAGALPTAPALVAPDGDATLSYRELAPRVEFRWEPVEGAEGYRLLVSRSPDFQGAVIDQRLTRPHFTYGNFTSGPYYWRVSALQDGAEGPPSEPRAVIVTSVQREPALAVEFPGGVVRADHVTLTGTSEPGVRVLVAGEPVASLAEGRWTTELRLRRGFNVVVVEAIDRVGNTAYQSKVLESKF